MWLLAQQPSPWIPRPRLITSDATLTQWHRRTLTHHRTWLLSMWVWLWRLLGAHHDQVRLKCQVGASPRNPHLSVLWARKRIRQRVGRNLLGATQSVSPLTPRYDNHSDLYSAKVQHCKNVQHCKMVLVKKGVVVLLLQCDYFNQGHPGKFPAN